MPTLAGKRTAKQHMGNVLMFSRAQITVHYIQETDTNSIQILLVSCKEADAKPIANKTSLPPPPRRNPQFPDEVHSCKDYLKEANQMIKKFWR